MAETYADLPGWTFTIDEVSAGAYRVLAVDSAGRSVEAAGSDPEELLEHCRARAHWILSGAPTPRTPPSTPS